MICLYRVVSPSRDMKADTFQDSKSFGEHIREFLNGNHTINDSMQGSYDFASESDVDFNKELPPSQVDLYDALSGQVKVFPDPVVPSDPIPEVGSNPTSSPTPEAPSE